MACSIDSTVAGASANSYISIADADTYHTTHLYSSDWDDAGSDEKCRALQMATRLLDQWFDWNGSPTNSSQALLWPRVAVIGPNGYEEASDAIPTRIANATAELARQLIAKDRTADADVETDGISSVKAGSVYVSFRGNTSSKPIPDAVLAFVNVYGRKKARGGDVTLLRG